MASDNGLYTINFLSFYDFLVHTFTTNYMWRCSTESVLLPYFAANVGPRHMDIGVGTGFFPGTHRQREEIVNRIWPEKLTLVDLNPSCLEKAAERVGRRERTTCLQADVMQPIVLPSDLSDSEDPAVFDSISLMYIIHCIPTPMKDKARLVGNVKPHLAREGTLFGATILGKGVKHNWLGRVGLWFLNKHGWFGNMDDGKEELVEALEANFHEVETTVVGTVLLFRARKPKECK